jgi:YegS/Rv2252/BmrU family lipid kinase
MPDRAPGSPEDIDRPPGEAPRERSATIVILNLTAGAGRARRGWKGLRPELRDWRTEPEVVETTAAGHATELARAAVAAGAGLVIAAGGDGTAHEVVQGLMEAGAGEAGTAFAHLPLGTGCDLATGLGLPRQPAGLLRRLRAGRDTWIDVGVAEMSGAQGSVRRYFLNAANVGLGPAVARRVKESPRLVQLGKLAYVLASVRELSAARPQPLSWRTDAGETGRRPVLNLFVCNGPSLAGGMRPCPDASLTDGILHVAVVGALGRPAAFAQMGRLATGRPFDHPEILAFTCRSIDLEGPPIDVETDGEIAGRLPARIAVLPGALRVRLPG